MVVLGFLVCGLAAFRLWPAPPPLSITAAVVAVVNLVSACAGIVAARRGRSAPRVLTACQHVTLALGGFFLFVSFALP